MCMLLSFLPLFVWSEWHFIPLSYKYKGLQCVAKIFGNNSTYSICRFNFIPQEGISSIAKCCWLLLCQCAVSKDKHAILYSNVNITQLQRFKANSYFSHLLICKGPPCRGSTCSLEFVTTVRLLCMLLFCSKLKSSWWQTVCTSNVFAKMKKKEHCFSKGLFKEICY